MSNTEMPITERRLRTLTDEDAEAIAEALREKVIEEFYKDLGKSLWGFIWKALVLAAIGFVSYSKMKGNAG